MKSSEQIQANAQTRTDSADVAVIGAGPAGAIISALLNRKGHKVVVIERQHFPRFSIGESLLPQCMEFIAEAGMLEAVNNAGFQFKNGAAFTHNGNYSFFDFTDKFSPGPGTTFQVQRAVFDHLLASEAQKQGVEIRYGHGLTAITTNAAGAELQVQPDNGDAYQLNARYVLDASGFGRVLPRLLDLELPSNFPARTSVFTHIQDNITADWHDRSKILVTVHPQYSDVWFWLIPFAGGRCSLGVVGESHYFEGKTDLQACLQSFVMETSDLGQLLNKAVFDTPVQKLSGYACNVKSLWGQNFALLGNAGEFLDPVFSSGVTIAMKSASLAAPLVDRQLRGGTVDWQNEYAVPLKRGVDTFRNYVSAWYDGRFQDVVFFRQDKASPKISGMISSILAGYAWDENNPFVAEPARRLNALADLCRR
ncbi:MAG: NAD(P)/FAD-dependent oxidoreductase [Gammaproteobacteria bacterium]|nr:MAG: NAD(P)/FAD-dependent oxidoreductase [Gammaproteobacteria bacterium]